MAFLKHQSYTRDESDVQMDRVRADWMTRFDQHLLQVREKLVVPERLGFFFFISLGKARRHFLR